MFGRLIVWNLRTSIRWWWAPSTIALFALVGFYGVARLNSVAEMTQLRPAVWDGFFLSFSGPPIGGTMLDGLIWLVPQIFLFYLVGDSVSGELAERGESVLPAIGSRWLWWMGKVSSLAISVFAYFTVGFLVVLAISAKSLPWSLGWSRLMLSPEFVPSPKDFGAVFIIGLMFLLLIATALTTVLAQAILAMRFNSINAFIIVSGLAILAWFGSYSRIAIFLLPGNQSMLGRHSLLATGLAGFSIGWSLAYNVVAIGGAIALGAWWLNRLDISGLDF